MSETEFRIEHDSMGEVRVPAAAKWRAQTQRAVENFPISGSRSSRDLIVALARIKGAAAGANAGARRARRRAIARAIRDAADEVIEGGDDDQFPIDVFQTGSGTSSNMNANEVLATLAPERLGSPGAPERPRQRLAVVQRRVPVRDPRRRRPRSSARPDPGAASTSRAALARKAEEFATVVKSGRTHLMDATPVTLGQEFGGYAAQVDYGIERLQDAACRGWPSCRWAAPPSAPGSTRPPGFAAQVIARARRGHRTCRSPRRATTSRRRAPGTRWSRPPGRCGRSRSRLNKIANDIRWMGSGPRAGLAEIAPARPAAGLARSCRARSTRCMLRGGAARSPRR